MNREPALIAAAAQAVVALVVTFLSLTPDQTAAVLAATAAVLGVLVRARVTPTGHADK